MMLYSSHGEWASLGRIRELEIEERGNSFPDLPLPDNLLALWVCLDPTEAYKYTILAGDVDVWEDFVKTYPVEARAKALEAVTSFEVTEDMVLCAYDEDDGFLCVELKGATP